MNGLDKIIQRIEAEADEETSAVLSKARKDAEKILANYKDMAQKEYDSILAEGKQSAAQISMRAERTARLDSKKSILESKQQLISDAYALAMDRILHLPEDAYVDFLARLAGGAASDGSEKVVLNAAERESVGAKVVERANRILAENGKNAALVLSDETRDIPGGVILKSGKIEVNCSINSLLELNRGTLDASVAGILFA